MFTRLSTVMLYEALNIIYTGLCGMPYTSTLFLAGLTSLTECREQLDRKFFDSTVEPRSCLHHLLPPSHDYVLLSCLRVPSKFPCNSISNRTKKYSTLHILCCQQVSDQLNISSACTVYYLHVSLFIVVCVFTVFLF